MATPDMHPEFIPTTPQKPTEYQEAEEEDESTAMAKRKQVTHDLSTLGIDEVEEYATTRQAGRVRGKLFFTDKGMKVVFSMNASTPAINNPKTDQPNMANVVAKNPWFSNQYMSQFHAVMNEVLALNQKLHYLQCQIEIKGYTATMQITTDNAALIKNIADTNAKEKQYEAYSALASASSAAVSLVGHASASKQAEESPDVKDLDNKLAHETLDLEGDTLDRIPDPANPGRTMINPNDPNIRPGIPGYPYATWKGKFNTPDGLPPRERPPAPFTGLDARGQRTPRFLNINGVPTDDPRGELVRHQFPIPLDGANTRDYNLPSGGRVDAGNRVGIGLNPPQPPRVAGTTAPVPDNDPASGNTIRDAKSRIQKFESQKTDAIREAKRSIETMVEARTKMLDSIVQYIVKTWTSDLERQKGVMEAQKTMNEGYLRMLQTYYDKSGRLGSEAGQMVGQVCQDINRCLDAMFRAFSPRG